MKRNSIVSSTLYSWGIAAVIFCIMGVIFDQVYKGNFEMEGYAFTKMVIGTFAIGMGFGLPTFVYNNENMPLATQMLIHMGVGCIVMTVTAFIVGWIPTEKGVGAVVAVIVGEIAVAIVIWLIFYTHQRKLVSDINKRIAEMNQ